MASGERSSGRDLLNALRLAVRADQGVENRQHVTPVIQHTSENILELRIELRLAMLFGENGAGHFDVAPQLVSRMTAQKEPVEKSGLALRIVELLQRINSGNELNRRGHKENAVYPKAFRRQVGLAFCCRVAGNTLSPENAAARNTNPPDSYH